jgi:hypothetical protein
MSGKARRIAEVLRSRNTSEGIYQALLLEDKSYALIRGGNPVQRRDVLPFEPRDGVAIEFYPKIGELKADWAACMDDIENSDIMLGWRPDR